MGLAQLAAPQVVGALLAATLSAQASHAWGSRAAHSSTVSGRTARGCTISSGISWRRKGLAQLADPQLDRAVKQGARCGSQRRSHLAQLVAPPRQLALSSQLRSQLAQRPRGSCSSQLHSQLVHRSRLSIELAQTATPKPARAARSSSQRARIALLRSQLVQLTAPQQGARAARR
jgi:hypothetical protein